MGADRSGGALEGRAQLIDDNTRPAASHFFGRRKGKALSLTKQRLLADHLPSLRVDPDALRGLTDLRALFNADISEVWLEIGFGAGEHLIAQAAAHADVGLLGIEPFVNGVASCVADATTDDALHGRVRIYDDDAMHVLPLLPAQSISRAFMLFPDPWPKRRHRDRRLFGERLLSELDRLLKPGGEFRFASDIADYAEQASDLLSQHGGFRLAHVSANGERPDERDWPLTRYERKARLAGRFSTYISARRVSAL
jgi:tRNA (guanine-N7-)-methyltransferase